jgi:hypothetical protein
LAAQVSAAQIASPGTVNVTVVNPDGSISSAVPYAIRLQRTATAGGIATVAGTGAQSYSGDGGPATSAELFDAGGVGVDAAGNPYIAHSGNNRVRMVRFQATSAPRTAAWTRMARSVRTLPGVREYLSNPWFKRCSNP